MRKLGKQEIEDIAIGATVLGTGGGGDPYIGKLMTLQAIEEHGEITLLSPDEVPDDALVVSSAMMGAPTVLFEKPPSGEEAKQSFQMLEDYLGKEIFGTYPIEAGGLNSLQPLVLAAELGIPVIDADGMGRAFPELQMVTFHLDGIEATPMVMADEKGNTVLMNTINSEWTEKLARPVTSEMGGSAMMSIYPMLGENIKESGIHHILTLAEEIGRSIRLARQNDVDPIEEVLKVGKGYELFRGKVNDIHRRTEGGFVKGIATIDGTGNYKADSLRLHFQNEHLLAEMDGRVLCTTPDLIAVLDAETGKPITTEGIKYGARCVVIAMPCHAKWRTDAGIELSGPRKFGYDIDYVPIETLVEKETETE